MLLPLVTLLTAFAAGPQAQTMGAQEAARPAPQPVSERADGQVVSVDVERGLQRVCRGEAVTGTRFPVQVCRTRRLNDAERAESREMLRRMQGARVPPVG